MSKGIERVQHNGAGLRIGIAVTRWNRHITGTLLERCKDGLRECQVADENIIVRDVPGSYELPLGAKFLFEQEDVDAVVVLGSLIKGETMHFEYICEAVTQGLMRLNLDYGKPVIFGVLACLNEEQAVHRANKDGLDHGHEWGISAVEMALLAKVK